MATKSVISTADPRFLKEDGTEVFTGNEAMVKGLLEAEGGTHLCTGYPGSPVSGIFDTVEAISDLFHANGMQAILANNEALAAAMLNGSQMLGLRAVAVMKSVGLHVASDALALGNLSGAHADGGCLVIVGDDPWNDSTQVPADSRFLSQHLHMPVLEPATLQELKDWIDIGFQLSRRANLYVSYLVTTNQADGGGSVQVRRNHFPRVNSLNPVTLDTAMVDFESRVLLPPRTGRREEDLSARYRRLWAVAEELGIDRILPTRRTRSRHRFGLIGSGLAACYLEQTLQELGLLGEIPVLKLGLTYPINPQILLRFAKEVAELVVVEERRPFLEQAVTHALQEAGVLQKVWGKTLPEKLLGIPAHGGLHPSLLAERLGPLFALEGDPVRQKKVRSCLERLKSVSSPSWQLPARTPTFCPGCPHRDSASVFLEIQRDFRNPDYMRRRHHREPVDLVFHGDTGCYTMLMFEPTKPLMHNYSGMGLGGGTGLGIDPFIRNKQVVFMGDSTFFHSGQIAISNSIKNRQNLAYIILDNRTTGMTGHQTTPGLEKDLLGNSTFTQNIEKIVEAITAEGHCEVIRINPGLRDQYRAVLEETVLRDGVKVIIADKECGILTHRRETRQDREEIRKKGFLPQKRYIQITPEVCEYCLACTTSTGCPGLTFTETDYGRKVQTDLSWCVADGACAKLYACPAFEEVTVVRGNRPNSTIDPLDFHSLPAPRPRSFSGTHRLFLTGVGGMGIASTAAVLVRAGHREGYQVLFCDRNGLAIRNGAVYSHIVYRHEEAPPTTAIPLYGAADLILGLDALETARALDGSGRLRVGSRDRTGVILNSSKTPTVLSLLGREDFCVQELEERIRQATDARRFFGCEVSALAERHFGTKLYANTVLVGIAFQRGELPLSQESLEWAIQQTMGGSAAANWKAFLFGRYLAEHPEEFSQASEPATPQGEIAKSLADLEQEGSRGKERGQRLWQCITQGIAGLPLKEPDLRDFIVRIRDLFHYENAAYAEKYAALIRGVAAKDSPQFDMAATRAAIWNAHRVMAIKDEVEVARLLTSSEKKEKDRDHYHVDPARGDRILYRHLTRPEFILGPLRFRFRMESRDWMLQIMRRAKFLRRILIGWHQKERHFRDWYCNLLERFAFSSPADYQKWLTILRLPESVRGYREIRYGKMEQALAQAEKLLAESEAPAESIAR
ncbi:2-oxoacid:acceptor oxidoreductase family protein [Verrucomicrobium sp. 3C]|uniref:2-oxoacid:acceptor oxidoreductase family protein n=1 Tax=Verrucomicrobium sp. 3C TaxID=1134055 RepID=UPI00036F8BF1|nr:2-oxoacid:acceptor oxidoreductase family protein [Verrucomicrobium sp. 3C]